MLRCTNAHKELLLNYLKQEAECNIFMIADIMNYGFDSDVQSVWADIEEEKCNAVYLWFCNNLLIYSHKETLNVVSLETILDMKKPDQIMAKRKILEQILSVMKSDNKNYSLKSKQLLALKTPIRNASNQTEYPCRSGEYSDIDKIYDFLQSGELAPLYRSKAMIEKRIEIGEGVHLLIEVEGDIVAQINSAASTPYSVMLGGLFTKTSYRRKGMAGYLVTQLCQQMFEEHRIPCLISDVEKEQNLFYKLGFEKVEDFTTLEPKK